MRHDFSCLTLSVWLLPVGPLRRSQFKDWYRNGWIATEIPLTGKRLPLSFCTKYARPVDALLLHLVLLGHRGPLSCRYYLSFCAVPLESNCSCSQSYLRSIGPSAALLLCYGALPHLILCSLGNGVIVWSYKMFCRSPFPH